jgi:hypothetical protein
MRIAHLSCAVSPISGQWLNANPALPMNRMEDFEFVSGCCGGLFA